MELISEKRRKVREAVAAEILAEYKEKPEATKKDPVRKKRLFARQRRYFGCCYARSVHEAVVDGDGHSILRQITKAQERDEAKIRRLGGVERAENYSEDPEKGFVGGATVIANAYDVAGRTPLSLAIKAEREDLAALLLTLQANPNKGERCDAATGATPLATAIFADLPATALELTRYDCDVDVPNRSGMSPLMLACLVGDVDVAGMLLEHKADPDARDDAGWTPLTYAAYGGHLACVKLVLDAGADHRAKDRNGHTAKDWAFYMRVSARRPSSGTVINSHGTCEAYLETYRPKLVGDW
ncbi:hypothetical protein CTAYLR_007190 [Chrysophaeum taylorii]|uniref:Uncharacterized protein n=1 Tax=Chrysophaeum taylorii TaxID=2483200 RepID=A0AAD7UPJ7_9STRA|nr:hypothetical protein CTAYLR_007190 [Chrysophaeum taylorii]